MSLNHNLQRNVNFLSVEEESKFENNKVVALKYGTGQESINFLGIYSEKSAVLLNEVINWRINRCDFKSRLSYSDVKSLKGGGLFVKCHGEVVISSIREVGLKFKETHGEYIKKYIRVASGINEIIKAIKDKIANELKKFWQYYSKYINSHDGIIRFILNKSDNSENVLFEYCEDDYRILYEVLKGRNINKLKAKYGQTKWDEMIGENLKDQFVITAIKALHNEILKIVETRDNDINDMNEAHRQAYAELCKTRQENEMRIANEAADKIKNLQNQIQEMMKMGNAMTG
jgi:hypothetical protein